MSHLISAANIASDVHIVVSIFRMEVSKVGKYVGKRTWRAGMAHDSHERRGGMPKQTNGYMV
jgi:hypothetical protein